MQKTLCQNMRQQVRCSTASLQCVDLHRFTRRAVAVFVVGEELDLRSRAQAVEAERGVVIGFGVFQSARP